MLKPSLLSVSAAPQNWLDSEQTPKTTLLSATSHWRSLRAWGCSLCPKLGSSDSTLSPSLYLQHRTKDMKKQILTWRTNLHPIMVAERSVTTTGKERFPPLSILSAWHWSWNPDCGSWACWPLFLVHLVFFLDCFVSFPYCPLLHVLLKLAFCSGFPVLQTALPVSRSTEQSPSLPCCPVWPSCRTERGRKSLLAH